MKKKIILIKLLESLYNNKKKEFKIIFFNSKKNIKLDNNTLYILQKKKIYINFFRIIFFLYINNISYKKNCFLLFKKKNIFFGNNLLPDWPSNYKQQNFFYNILDWIKYFLKLFVYNKYLLYIIFETN